MATTAVIADAITRAEAPRAVAVFFVVFCAAVPVVCPTGRGYACASVRPRIVPFFMTVTGPSSLTTITTEPS